MALGTPSESPAVVVREIDLTGGVPNVQSTTGAIAGSFNWGPINVATRVSNEAELVDNFGSPSSSNISPFLSSTQYLRYSSNLFVTRAGNDDSIATVNAYAINTGGATINNIKDSASFDHKVWNEDTFESLESSILSASIFDSAGDSVSAVNPNSATNVAFVARYAGSYGNSLKVSVLHAMDSDTDSTTGSTSDSAFSAWTYASEFDAKPGTSLSAAAAGAQRDEMHLVVVDEDGVLTGTRGTVLERFAGLSARSGAKDAFGQSVFARDVINNTSEYIYMANFYDSAVNSGAGTQHDSDYGTEGVPQNYSFIQGNDGSSLTTGQIETAYNTFADKDQIEVDFIIAPGMLTSTSQQTVVNNLVATATARKDCVVVTSPARNDIVNVVSDATKVTNTTTTAAGFTRSSYLVVDNNFLKVYDKYNDNYELIPASSSVAGIMAATDFNRAAWFSPAGSRRGQVLGITSLAYSPTKAQRDTLYKAGVNPVANIPGQGALLFGDKTFLGRVSAFDRINVRRLFLVLERAIGRAAEQVLFEFNDEFTRAEFVNIVEPVLREVQGRRGITDFRVVCDETNNTAAVIDRNEFKADIFIKPARSINYVTLSFVAVRTGVDFEEVVGTV